MVRFVNSLDTVT
jgi:hypothetical protein